MARDHHVFGREPAEVERARGDLARPLVQGARLSGLLDQLLQLLWRVARLRERGRVAETAARGSERVPLGAILEVVGRSSFGPLILLAGIVTLAPVVGDLPGVPTTMAVLVVATSGQMLFGRQHIWLPRWLLERSVARAKLCKAVSWGRRPARFIDRFLRPRLTGVAGGAGKKVVAIACVIIGVAMPVTELVPFSANVAGAALTAFGLSLIAHDGLLALLAFGFTGLTAGIAVHYAV